MFANVWQPLINLNVLLTKKSHLELIDTDIKITFKNFDDAARLCLIRSGFR